MSQLPLVKTNIITITGASGQLGQLVVQGLLQHTDPTNIIALARDTAAIKNIAQQGVNARRADYTQPDTLKAAFEGASKLLLISSSEVGQRIAQHKAVIDAAKNANVELLAYTSLLKADTSPLSLAIEHKATEEAISASNLPAVILRNGWYNENYTASSPIAVQMGTLLGTAGEGRFSTATRQDFADAAVAVLLSADNQAGKVYELAGDTSFTLADYAAEISAQAGSDIPYQQLEQAVFANALKQSGLSAPLAEMLAETEAHAPSGALQDGSKTLSKLIGRPTTPIAESLKMALTTA